MKTMAMALLGASMAMLSGCGVQAEESDTATVNGALTKTIVFEPCEARFSGKGATSGGLAHDGITRCSEQDGRFGEKLYLNISGHDRSHVQERQPTDVVIDDSWSGDVNFQIGDNYTNVELTVNGRKIAAPRGPATVAQLARYSSCKPILHGEWVKETRSYATWAELACK